MIVRTVYSILFIALCSGCVKSIEAKKELSNEDYKKTLLALAPYVIKKADAFTHEERFDSKNRGFYQNFIELTKAELTYYHRNDSAQFFFFKHRDLTSLKEDYRGLGGYFKTDKNDSIVFVNLLYHTPRFKPEEMEQKGKILFESMIEKGEVDRYIGKREFIDVPNNDFYYNTKTNRWDHTPNSSWKFLEEAKERALPSDTTAN